MSSSRVNVFEVGVRDGLQNESRPVSTPLKLALIKDLVEAGIRDLEIGAFVRPDRVPQMADTDQIYARLKSLQPQISKARFWSLVPNLKGLAEAIKAGAENIAIFTAASESFCEKNIGMSVGESLRVYAEVISEAKNHGIRIRGYVSTAFGCPFEGKVAPRSAIRVADQLLKLGVFQVSVGDTIGVATPKAVQGVMGPLIRRHGAQGKIAVHFHDTRGTALANTLRALDLGVRDIDSSVAGLGGCPFAPGATGNLATEDLIYMLDGMGIKTGIHLAKLSQIALKFSRRIGRPLSSRYLQAYASECLLAGRP